MIRGQGGRSVRGALGLALWLCLGLLMPSSALAAPHPPLETFGSVAQPTFTNPAGMAVDQSTGDVLVIDAGAGTISRFHEDGTPSDFSALGSNEITGLSFGSPGEVEVAVDNSGGATDGNIYVPQALSASVKIFDEDGSSLGELTASGSTSFAEPCGVAVDPSGNVYVGDFSGAIHKFEPAGAVPVNGDGVADISFSENCIVAAGAGPTEGFIFASHNLGSVEKINSTTGAEEEEVAGGFNTTLSVDPSSGHVYTARGEEIAEFDASGSAEEVSTTALASAAQGVAINGSTGNFYVTRAGEANIEVFGPGGETFPVPVLIALSPIEGPTAGGNLVEITGTGFTKATKVEFGGAVVGAPFTENTETTIKVKAATHAAGTVDVTVTTPGGTSAVTPADEYTYVATPAVTALSPAKGPTAGGNLVEITGLNLSEATRVEFGATVVEAPFTESTATKIKVNAPAHAAGKVHVRVATLGGTSGKFPQDEYTYMGSQALSLATVGTGTISCNGGACAASYPFGTQVTLAAAASSGSSFAGWSGGGCSGNGACVVTMTANTAVTATFSVTPPPPPPPAPGTPQVPPTAKFSGGKVALPISCQGAGACSGTFKLKAKVGGKEKVIGTSSFNVAAGATKTIKVTITNGQVKKKLQEGKAVTATLSGGGLDGAKVKLKKSS